MPVYKQPGLEGGNCPVCGNSFLEHLIFWPFECALTWAFSAFPGIFLLSNSQKKLYDVWVFVDVVARLRGIKWGGFPHHFIPRSHSENTYV